MAKDEFLLSVQTAVGTLLPRVDAQHPYTDRKELERVLRGADLWLSKSSVKGFDPSDFPDLDRKDLANLERNINEFLRAVKDVDPKKPASHPQHEAALPPFLEISEVVRNIVLEEWLTASGKLIEQAEEWAISEDWPAKRYPWSLTERFLGTYELDRLVFGLAGTQMALIPLGRFTMSSRGSFDLAVMPAYESVTIARGPSLKWMIRPLPGENTSHRWSKAAFVETSNKLARMG